MFDRDKEDTTLTEEELQKVEEVTEDERDDLKRKEWRPHYEEQLEILIAHVKKHCGPDIDKKTMKKLKETAKLCAKNKAVIDQKYGK